jgi:hypothetical protein
MIGLTIMDVHEDEMRAIVQFYLNNNLLNTAFQKHHESAVESVRQRSNGRFTIEFRARKQSTEAVVKMDAAHAVAGGGNE